MIASLFVTTRERWHEFVRRSAATGADGDNAYPCIDLVDPGLHHLPPARVPGRPVPLVPEADCVGCNLCLIVGPVNGCMQMVPIDSGKPPLSWEHYQAGLAAGTISPNPAQP